MSLSEDIKSDVQGVLDTPWSIRKGQVVPSTTNVSLAGGAVELDATFLYADLADSSKMAKELDRRVAAKIMKSFLATSCRLIKSQGGTIQSFDGDRVMGVFVGNSKNSDAARCALHINYVVNDLIKTKFENKYESVRNASFGIRHGVGVDTGTVLTVRAGARGSNDLIWIGRAPNLAAKLSDLRESPHHTFITASVYNMLSDRSKYGGQNNENMWERRNWNFLGDSIRVYRSNWQWAP
ncbi:MULTISPECIES: adenylate/guanylate cyclase domain-containing protein [unclassified Idiomarina]|jgi:class 3 adenylate cyclase|uniref:adenylate/guanylate cyclase domain-containing protein n=1 Tax=unclassified Idiomarina TaxID=2614829 RepID=UPI00257F6A50|nr:MULTISPECIES: adenylate/guanylate cyclase domain-containing protein [unclassified Idiomarina]|tara:strand:- start:43830 stop:44543 length:714 start_codon:yes stop_codon:yes gene_type:complete